MQDFGKTLANKYLDAGADDHLQDGFSSENSSRLRKFEAMVPNGLLQGQPSSISIHKKQFEGPL